ncbi:MAG: TrbC/VirB2 family protein, partial [Rickettsiales bacterium]|nr:TrbC/VirB2 family protein [Rickettsiales bacterium]
MKVLFRFFLILTLLTTLKLPYFGLRASPLGFSASQNSGRVGLTNEELLAAKRNGMVSALCYVLDIITGKAGRAIIAVAVLAIGWMFLLGGVKWTTLLTFTLACSLTFGGAELAHIISRNNYSCSSTKLAEEYDKSIVYNRGTCGLNTANHYSPGQEWYLCSNSDGSCRVDDSSCMTRVTNDTLIDENPGRNTLALKKCQAGHFKFNESLLHREQCKRDSNDIGYFALCSDNSEDAECKKACLRSDL